MPKLEKTRLLQQDRIVLSGTKVESGSIYAGNPAKRLKDVNPEQTSEMIQKIARNYKMYSDWYK